ncbi:MAG: hypothetical protein ABL962_16755, partial [Fimbriimonadaceae bacterium]
MLYQLSYRASDLKGRYWSMLQPWRNGFFSASDDCTNGSFPLRRQRHQQPADHQAQTTQRRHGSQPF